MRWGEDNLYEDKMIIAVLLCGVWRSELVTGGREVGEVGPQAGNTRAGTGHSRHASQAT